jgi:hypothetical protein
MLCNCCVRELLILAHTWFAFGLPSKTGCDTSRGRDDRGSNPLILAAAALVSLFLLDTVLGDSAGTASLGDPSLRRRVPGTALGDPGTLITQSEECGDVVHITRGQLLKHLLVAHPLTEGSDDGSV